jgi:hypothetical protein
MIRGFLFLLVLAALLGLALVCIQHIRGGKLVGAAMATVIVLATAGLADVARRAIFGNEP